jgi:uncharacterized protein (DUF1800 family)
LISAPLSTLNGLAQPRTAGLELIKATMARQIWSRRQLFEIMVDFWSNHLNVFALQSDTHLTKPIEDRAVIRPNAMGRFVDLLLADAKSPAMLNYLDNAKSKIPTPNENYGRELLQLHTVGPTGFTEADVKNSALVLTGRSVAPGGEFLYKPTWHFVGPVRVMGWSASNASTSAGLSTGDDYVSYLARHEQTALLLSRKLAIRFVSDNPPQTLVDRLAGVFLDSDTAIVPWLRALFQAPEFAASVGQKTRRPLEDVVATVRVLGIGPPPARDLSDMERLRVNATNLGMQPLTAYPPTGFSDVAAGWWSIGGLLGRCNWHRLMARGHLPTLPRPPLSALIAGAPMTTHGEMADRLTVSLTGQTFRPDHREALLGYAGLSSAQPYDKRLVDRWLRDLTELVLNSPYMGLR